MVHRLAAFGFLALALASCRPADDAATSVATDAAPSRADAPARAQEEPRAAQAPASDLLIGGWVLVTYQAESGFEEAVAANERYTIEFTADGRVSGLADCNRYTGAYSEPAPGRLAMGANMAVTMAACPPASRSADFLRAVGAATRYEHVGGELRLFGGGDALTFEREPPAEPQAATGEVGRTFVYDCGANVSFTVRTGPGEVALWAPASLGREYRVLSATPAASGVRYVEGDTVFWSKGDFGSFEVGGQRFTDCQSNPAKVPWADAVRRGAVFRGLGQEPAWTVEIERDAKLVLVTDYGAQRTEVAHAAPLVESTRSTYRSTDAALALTVVVERRACTDSMSGEAFEAAVTVTLADRMLYGCGRFL